MGRTTSNKRKRTPTVSTSKGKTANPRSRLSTSKGSSATPKGKTPSSSFTPKHKAPIEIDYYDIVFKNDEHKKKYERLFTRGVVATRFCDANALRSLHIEHDVSWLVNNIGWGDFIQKKPPTYKRITLEFLSSLKANVTYGKGCEHGSITFQLYNQEHTWTLEKLNVVLGLPNAGLRCTPTRWYADDTWRIIAGGVPWNKDGVKGSFIRHPVIRYVQRLLSCTVLGRHDGGNVRKDDVFFIDSMLHAKEINTGAFLIKQMETLANRSNTRGAIVQGGYVTLIALSLGHKEELLAEGSVQGTDVLNLASCSTMGWIKETEGTILWSIRDDGEDELPSPEAMSLRDPNNWSFNNISSLTREPNLPDLIVPPRNPVQSNLPNSHETASPSLVSSLISAINKVQGSIDEIKDEQKQIKEQMVFMSTTLHRLDTWLQQQGFSSPPHPPPL